MIYLVALACILLFLIGYTLAEMADYLKDIRKLLAKERNNRYSAER